MKVFLSETRLFYPFSKVVLVTLRESERLPSREPRFLSKMTKVKPKVVLLSRLFVDMVSVALVPDKYLANF
jgi:hypothetical protein